MIVSIKGKDYTAGALVAHHAMVAMELNGTDDHKSSIALMFQTVAESLINGTEKVYYDEIKPEMLGKYSKLLTMNLSLPEITKVYTDLMGEMNSGTTPKGKPKR